MLKQTTINIALLTKFYTSDACKIKGLVLHNELQVLLGNTLNRYHKIYNRNKMVYGIKL
jgi:hypothetical protein